MITTQTTVNVVTKKQLLQWEDLNVFDRLAIKDNCERSFEFFIRVFFQLLQGQHFHKNWHHALMCEAAEDVYYNRVTRLIINVSPGSTKTEIFSIHFVAWGILKCISEGRPSRWFPMSYSSSLVKANTEQVKAILESEPFTSMWPLEASKTTKAKDNWIFIDRNANRHVCFGCSIGGQVTGRRAGYMQEGFTGALLLDDPVSPTMAESPLKLATANRRINRVCRSRLAHDSVPIVMIQQRVAVNDTTKFMMSDKMPDEFRLIKIPALIGREYIRSLQPELRAQCLADTGFSGERVSYWPRKEPTATLLKMEEADNYMFSAQYQQEPNNALLEGVVYRKQMLQLEAENRLCHLPIEPSLKVHTFWDLGINDDMAIWLMQHYGKEYRLIACYANRDEGMEHYINWLLDFKDVHGIRFGTHYAPHDISVRDLMTGVKRADIAKKMGITLKMVQRCHSKRESIQALKNIFGQIWIDRVRCDTDAAARSGAMAEKTGLKALQKLCRLWDHTQETFKDNVGPKWATNYTDALQQMALVYNEDNIKPKQSREQSRGTATGWMGV